MDLKKHILLIAFCFSVIGCVSIDVAPETESAEGLVYKSPGGSFERRDAENLDAYFVDKKSGNSISLKSSCFDPADPSIENLESTAFTGMNIEKEISKEEITYNSRAALNTRKLVKIDGVPVLVQMLIFKKNNCNYLISHVGVEKTFPNTESNFKNFLDQLRAP
ncbi:MAG: hypothetical protein CL674_12045 [Bdellovibrionaceae bacterium]|nr:hypothetical protein [Pseudobdellovibrionaceae bacterium]|tara:strand:- start:156405 stop:156896 length:492 start_codon:yes stop_codon:yes gene_type:complete